MWVNWPSLPSTPAWSDAWNRVRRDTPFERILAEESWAKRVQIVQTIVRPPILAAKHWARKILWPANVNSHQR